jgi:hypothetical protein
MKELFIIILILSGISSNVFAQQEREQIICVLNKYIQLNQNFLKDSLESNRIAVEQYSENELLPSLSKIQKIVCAEKDTFMLNLYLKMLLNTANSTDEVSINTLGQILICQPKFTYNVVRYFNHNDRKHIIGFLEFGLLNIQEEIQDKPFKKAMDIIQNLKDSL